MSEDLIGWIIVGIVGAYAIYHVSKKNPNLDLNQDGKVDVEDLKAAKKEAEALVEDVVEKAEAVIERVAPKKKAAPKKKEAEKPLTKSAIARMAKADLIVYAKKQGAKVDDSMTKAQILELLK
jgi:hypothetical protein